MKDREKLRKCVRDIKDFEIYRSVMEATMLRMQGELNSLLEEQQQKAREVDTLKIALNKQRTEDGKQNKTIAGILLTSYSVQFSRIFNLACSLS